MMQYQTQRRVPRPTPPVHHAPEAKGPSLQALQAGAVPTAEQLGHPVDLPGAIRSKMEAAFGMDLSGVRLYESQTVADAGAEAVTMGSRISFAPGKLDFSSGGGQALLGHELSHVVSQARGEASGRGFLQDSALESRADREGAMAAAGESVYSGPMTPFSASSTAQAAGPMQAKKKGKKQLSPEEEAAAKRSNDLEHLAESAIINNHIGNHWAPQLEYENKLVERFSQEDRAQLLGDLWKKKLEAARAVNGLGAKKGSAAAASGEAAERFQSFTSLGADFNLISSMRATTEADARKSRNDMLAAGNSTLSPEEMAEIDAATNLLSEGQHDLSADERSAMQDRNIKRAKKLAKTHKKRWGTNW